MEWSPWGGGPWEVRPNIEGMEGEWMGGGGYAQGWMYENTSNVC